MQAGVSIQVVSELLRHSDVRITASIYAHLAPENAREAVKVLEWDSHDLVTVKNVMTDKIG